jgi:Asp-tRNA(Asn)/Glu-tRNA(Gln) amidotransferase A subunit family amidase
VRRAAEAFAARGCVVEAIEPPEGCATELFFAASGADGGAHLRRAVAAANGQHHPQFAALLGEPVDPPPSADAFFAIQRALFAFRSRARRLLAAYDVVLSPVVSGPAPEHGRPPARVRPADYLLYRAFEFCHVNAVAGVPAAVVPVATEDGLPVGVQIAAAPWREDLALAASALLESELGGFAINRRLALEANRESQTPSAGPKASTASSTGTPPM